MSNKTRPLVEVVLLTSPSERLCFLLVPDISWVLIWKSPQLRIKSC